MTDMNGSDVMLGSILGQLLASNAEQIRLAQTHVMVLERIQDDLQEMPHRLAAVMGRGHRSGWLDKLGISFREALGLGLAILTGLIGLAGGASLKSVVEPVQQTIHGP